MSTKTLKLLNSITTTTSAAATSTNRRRNSAAVTMLQSNGGSMFPHCNGPHNQQQHISYVMPGNPVSSDLQASYHVQGTTSTYHQHHHHHNVNSTHNGGNGHHTRNGSLHQEALKNARPVPQFSGQNSQIFQFSFEQPQISNKSQNQRQLFQSTQINQHSQPAFPFLGLNPTVDPSNIQKSIISNQHQNHSTVQPQQLKPPTQGLLPGGFFSLTPEDSYPPICSSNLPSTPLPNSQNSNPFFPIMPLNPIVQQMPAGSKKFPTGYFRPVNQRLTQAAISAVDSRDSRDFRWNRVVRYVSEVAAVHNPHFSPSEAWIMNQRHRVMSSPADDIENHSLWDGGSLGTNGVDDFIWDDDLQNGKRFTIPPKSEQGDIREEDHLIFNLEPSKSDFDLAFGYEVDDSNFRPPAKRSKSNESQKASRRGLHEYLAALRTLELSHVSEMRREAPLQLV